MVNIMTKKSLKKFTELLNRSEGISLTPIIVIMVVMSIMGGVFTSIMGGWKVSAPVTMNSTKAFYQAEAAAMFALQDASYRFYGGNFDYGTSTADPYVVSSVTNGNVTDVADCWFERPDNPTHLNDDATTGTNDDNVDDDTSVFSDDITFPNRYSIIATGRVDIGGTTTAKRQIKVIADIIPTPDDTIKPGIQTKGDINGTAFPPGFGMNNPSPGPSFGATVTYGAGIDNVTAGSESGPPAIVYRPLPLPDLVDVIDKNLVKALATEQGHFNPAGLTVNAGNDDYPESISSFYYSGAIPNFTYVNGILTVDAGYKAHGVIWVTGDVNLDDTGTMNAIIICEGGNINFIGINDLSNINGGIIHYNETGVINGNQNAAAIVVNDGYFDDLNATIPIITIDSWQEAVSAN